MRKLVLAATVFVLAGSLVVAGEVGPPQPSETSDIPLSVGVGYERHEAVYKPSSSSNLGIIGEVTAKQERAYLQVAFALNDMFEVYSRVGGANLNLKNSILDLGTLGPLAGVDSFRAKDSSMRFYTTLGAKGMLYEDDNIGVGPYIQASYFTPYRDRISLAPGVYGTLRVKDMWDVNAGLSAQARIGSAVVYGGPMLYASGARVSVSENIITPGGSTMRKRFEEEGSNIGSFIGARIPLPEGMEVGVEGRYRSAFSMGISLTKAF